ncbi:hypothetical protein FHR77_002937 [Frigoribacterium endophyticum]|nr:hypothetical protein [Frigoribacterium endophyticum]
MASTSIGRASQDRSGDAGAPPVHDCAIGGEVIMRNG